MDIHQNARLTPFSREALAQTVLLRQVTLNSAAAEFKVSPKTASKWVRRYQHEGRGGLRDRSSRPRHSPRRCSSDLVVRVEALRRQRWTGIRIALATGLSRATVSRVLRRLHLSRIRDLDPPPPVIRYEHPFPGDLLHLDIKKIGRFQAVGCRITGNRQGRIHRAGWEYVHVAIDDHSRIAFSQILLNQKAASAAAFLEAAVAYYARLGIAIRRLLTDNGPCYRSGIFRRLCHQLGVTHRFTRPYTPRTNGKAERFIQTALREWAYARSYDNSQVRAAELPSWIHQYNWHRPHASLNQAPPISRSGLDRNNLLSHHNQVSGAESVSADHSFLFFPIRESPSC
jgi:transposase InsO family protein